MLLEQKIKVRWHNQTKDWKECLYETLWNKSSKN